MSPGRGGKGGITAHSPRIGWHLCWQALLDGEPLKGYWRSQTQEYAARQRGEDFPATKYVREEELKLSPLPCWEHLSAEEIRDRIAGMVEEVEQEAAAARAERGLEVLGADAVLRQLPHTRPERTKRSPAPLVHAATKAARQALRKAYYSFVCAFRSAADTWKKGNLAARFPAGSFPPRPPFVCEPLRAGP